MDSRVVSSALALAAVVVLAGCLGSVETPAADGGIEERTIQVTASGEVSGEPDQALLTVGVSAVAASAEIARSRVAANVSSMRAALRDAGLRDDQIQTTSFFVGEERRDDETDVRQFRATHLFTIPLDDVASVGEFIDTAIANGASTVQGVQFTLSADRQQELRGAALTAAMESARTQAETLADAAVLSIVDVHSVETVEQNVFPAFELARDEAATNIEPGPVTVTAQVRVVYNATV